MNHICTTLTIPHVDVPIDHISLNEIVLFLLCGMYNNIDLQSLSLSRLVTLIVLIENTIETMIIQIRMSRSVFIFK